MSVRLSSYSPTINTHKNPTKITSGNTLAAMELLRPAGVRRMMRLHHTVSTGKGKRVTCLAFDFWESGRQGKGNWGIGESDVLVDGYDVREETSDEDEAGGVEVDVCSPPDHPTTVDNQLSFSPNLSPCIPLFPFPSQPPHHPHHNLDQKAEFFSHSPTYPIKAAAITQVKNPNTTSAPNNAR